MAQDLAAPPSSIAASVPSGVHRAAEAKKDDSGIINLAAASKADPEATLRAATAPLASQGLFDDELSQQPPMSAPVSAPLSTPASQTPRSPQVAQPAQPAPSIPPPAPASVPPTSLPQHVLAPTAAPIDLATARASAVEPSNQKSKNGIVIALVVALGAAAAGGLFVVKSRNAPDAHATAPVTTTVVKPTVAAAEPAAVATTTPEAPPVPAEPATDLNALPTAAPKPSLRSRRRA